MAPKTAAAEKKPAQPAKKAVAKKSSAGKKKGSKKAVESYKIYIYKVIYATAVVPRARGLYSFLDSQSSIQLADSLRFSTQLCCRS